MREKRRLNELHSPILRKLRILVKRVRSFQGTGQLSQISEPAQKTQGIYIGGRETMSNRQTGSTIKKARGRKIAPSNTRIHFWPLFNIKMVTGTGRKILH